MIKKIAATGWGLPLIISVLFLFSCTPKSNQMKPYPEFKARAELGEGSIWNYTDNRLYWIDIENGIIYIYNPQTRKAEKHFTHDKIGTIVPDGSGGAVVALTNGFYHIDFKTDSLTLLADIESDIKGNRFNDGKCDPMGRFWAGSMSVEDKLKKGTLYRMDFDHSIHKMIDSVSISNGIIWSLDNKTMYYIDTPTRQVKAFEYDNTSGDLGAGRVAITVPDSLGFPDGMTIDAEGKLWIALWGGGSVGRWDPETGKILQKIELPALNVTSCAFGGKDLETLYITTARSGLTPEQLKKYPQSGDLFSVKPGVRGVRSALFMKSH